MQETVGDVMLEVRLLSQFEVLKDGRRLTIPTRNAQSLLAYLLLNAGKAHRRERLAGLFWPDSSEENARSNLRHGLWRLRKALEVEGDSYFIIDDLTIAFNPHSAYSLDVHLLENIQIEDEPADGLIKALSAYSGDLLPGFYDEWISIERARVHALFEAAISRLLDILAAEGRWIEVIEWATRWIALGQWPEPAYRALMQAYASNGDLSKAIATYERLTQGLQKDLGIKPSEQTQLLYKRLKAGGKMDIPMETAARGKPTTKPSRETAPTKFSLPKIRRSNLPRPLTSFIGREKEILQVEVLVSKANLVTITGPGGVGKTRLAIEAARALEPQFRDGAWWVELAPLFERRSPRKSTLPQVQIDPGQPGQQSAREEHGGPGASDLVPQAVAKALRLTESPGLSLLEVLIEHLQDKKLLLVLDNCEHLIEDCAILAEHILGNCPEITLLATSREALGVPGEKAWLLPSLSLPDRGQSSYANIIQSEAVNLFIERAADILPGYEMRDVDAPTIARICHRLEGIPLAIELAAARMSLLSAQEIDSRLDSRFSLLTAGHRTALPKHKTLQAAIEWSYDLLEELEQLFFRRLSIFSGSFTLEAAEAICSGDGIRHEEVITLLGRLVDKSLLIVEPGLQDPDLPTRYRFLDTISSFGRIKLDEADESRLMRDRHATYYVRLVEAAEPELLLKDQVRWHKLLKAEIDNIRAVIEFAGESDRVESALRLVGALLWFFYRSGYNREGCELAQKALAFPSSIQFMESRARALNTAGFLQCALGDTTSARRSLEEALEIMKTTTDEAVLAWSLQFLGLVFSHEFEYDLADEALKEGLAIIQKSKNVNANSFVFFLGDVNLLRGERSRAKKIYEESAEILGAVGNKGFAAYPLRRLGYLALEQNDLPNAIKYFWESLKFNHETMDAPGVTASLASFAALALQLEEPVLAVRLLGAVEHRLETLSINLLSSDQIELARISNQLTSLFDEASFTAIFSEGWELSEELAIQLVEKIVVSPAYRPNSPI